MTVISSSLLPGHSRVCVLVEQRSWTTPSRLVSVERWRLGGAEVEVRIAEQTTARLSDDLVAEGTDVVVARGRSQAVLSLLRAVEGAGIATVNGVEAVQGVVDKAGMAVALVMAGLPTPATWFGAPQVLACRTDLPFPLVLKPITGDNARGLRVVHGREELASVTWDDEVALAQEWFRGDGHDVKLYVAGEAVWAVRRHSPVHGDGSRRMAAETGTPLRVTAEMRDLAVRCRVLFALELLGIDCVWTPQGLLVVEVNDFPTYRGVLGDPSSHLADVVLRRAAEAQRSEPARLAVPAEAGR